MPPRKPKGTPTSLNLYTLGDVFKDADEIPNRLSPTQVSGIKRCIAGGLVEIGPDKSTLRLTDEGRAARDKLTQV